jgi:hypothetical protein
VAAFRVALPQSEQVEFPGENCQGLDREGDVMSFGIYAIGFVIVIGGLIYGATLMHVPTHWIVVGAVVLLGLGILTGVQATRHKDPAG